MKGAVARSKDASGGMRVSVRTRSVHLAWALVLGCVLVLAVPPLVTFGNGTPVSIVLSYLSGLSNFGPTDATGVAELVLKEGDVRLTATGLTPLTGEEYRVWLVNTQDRKSTRLNSSHIQKSRMPSSA